MKKVPFYGNAPDNNQCMVAVYRMVMEYFLGTQMSMAEVADFVGYAPGQAVWTLEPLTKLAKMGFDIQMLEPFDYRAFEKKGTDYLYSAFSKEKADWQLANTNIRDIAPSIPDFLHTVRWENRAASLQDIDNMLTAGRLVSVAVNSGVLNGTGEYADHNVLIIGREGNSYIMHDPGLPPAPNRRVPRNALWEAMGGDHHTAEVTGFRLKTHIGERLDQYVVSVRPRLSRAFAAKLIGEKKVLVNGTPTKAGYHVKEGDAITIDYDESVLDAIPDIDLPILYEDHDCVVINKPAGILTHAQGEFIPEATVATFLRSRAKEGVNGIRAGIVHRLDRATSGVLIGAKTQAALGWLQRQFADRLVEKTYLAVVKGHLKQPEAVIDMPVERNPKAPATFRVGANGKDAVTQYKVLKENDTESLIELRPRTGRTHQLRVHLAHIGHPIVGDPLYGNGVYGDRLLLHAYKLAITLPDGERRTFTAPLPKEFEEHFL